MNGFERINKTLKGEWPDRRPVMLHNFMMAASEAGYSMKTFRENPENAADAFIQSVEKYHLDGVMIDFDTTLLAGAIGVHVDYPENEPDIIPKGLISSREQIDELKEVYISKNQRVQIWLETCRIIKNHFGDEVFVRGNCDQAPFSIASMVRGAQEWMLDLMVPGEEVVQLLDYCTEVSCQFIDLMVQTGVDMVSNGDSPAGPEMISPEMFREFALPYLRHEFARLDGVVYHLDGVGNLPNLQVLCAEPDLHTIQWVPGAGKERIDQWYDVIQRVLSVGKSVQVFAQTSEVDDLLKHVGPRGVLITLTDATEEEAVALCERFGIE